MESVEKTEESGWPFVRTMALHEVVDSTNDRAAVLVKEGLAALPLGVWAKRQTRGRGPLRSHHSAIARFGIHDTQAVSG